MIFSSFTLKIEGNVGGLLGAGGWGVAKGYVDPPLKLLGGGGGGGGLAPLLPMPMCVYSNSRNEIPRVAQRYM